MIWARPPRRAVLEPRTSTRGRRRVSSVPIGPSVNHRKWLTRSAVLAGLLIGTLIFTWCWWPRAIGPPPEWVEGEPGASRGWLLEAGETDPPQPKIRLPPSTVFFPERELTIPVLASAGVPADPQILGRLTSTQPLAARSGLSVLTSHIKTRTQAGILQQILDFRIGERLVVIDEAGVMVEYYASSLRVYPKAEVALRPDPSGERILAIVTCVGQVQPDGHLSDNLVLEFRLVRPMVLLRPLAAV